MTQAELKAILDENTRLKAEKEELLAKVNKGANLISLEVKDGVINTPIPVYATVKVNDKGTNIIGGLYGKGTLKDGKSTKSIRVSCTIMLA